MKNRMKSLATLVIVGAMFVTMCIAGLANAADKQINLRIDQLTFALDKNDQPYARAIVYDTFELNGVSYSKSVAVMAFGEGNDLEAFKEGDMLNAIVGVSEFGGNTSYRLLSVIAEQ